MIFYTNLTILRIGGALGWIYGLVLIAVIIYTIIALRKQAEKAEDKNKLPPGTRLTGKNGKDVKKTREGNKEVDD